jgi:hypothetical protein
MEVRFGSDSLRRLETDPAYDGGYAEAIAKRIEGGFGSLSKRPTNGTSTR